MHMDFKEKEFSNIHLDIPHKNLLKLHTWGGVTCPVCFVVRVRVRLQKLGCMERLWCG